MTIVERNASDWGDAGVGAAGTLGLMLVASGLVIVRRHSPTGGQRSGRAVDELHRMLGNEHEGDRCRMAMNLSHRYAGGLEVLANHAPASWG